jgi:hypothetical protein
MSKLKKKVTEFTGYHTRLLSQLRLQKMASLLHSVLLLCVDNP